MTLTSDPSVWHTKYGGLVNQKVILTVLSLLPHSPSYLPSEVDNRLSPDKNATFNNKMM